MGDLGVAAFSVFFMQSPSFLAHQRTLAEGRGRSNAQALFGMSAIPSDNHIRQMLDGAPTDHFDEVFRYVVEDLEAHGGLKAFRRLKRLGATFARLNPVYLGDDLYAHQPMCADVLAAGGSFIFGCKPSSHKTLTEYLTGAEIDSFSETVGVGTDKRIHRYRRMEGVPLRDGKDALHVNWLEIEISKPDGKVTYRNSFVTDLPVTRKTVAEIAACGRARWKIENETFNVLKNNGYSPRT
ncbi:MAG: hypothetical protein EPN20_19870 [Magnetospirillum sp.]|nr:MAG: hypothetical protein EPN20_19870 [Magnetospirillum sp.]